MPIVLVVWGRIMTQILRQCYSEVQETGPLTLGSGTAFSSASVRDVAGSRSCLPQMSSPGPQGITCSSSPPCFEAGTPGVAAVAEPDPLGCPARQGDALERNGLQETRELAAGPGTQLLGSPRGVVRPPRPSCFRGLPRVGFAADDISCGCWKRGGGAQGCADSPRTSSSSSPGPCPAPSPYKSAAASPPALTPCLPAACGSAAERPFSTQHPGAAGRRGAVAMATVVVEMDSEPSCSIPNLTSTSPSLSHRFLDSKFYLLVVVGELVTEEHLRRAIANIERGEVAGSGDTAGTAAAPPAGRSPLSPRPRPRLALPTHPSHAAHGHASRPAAVSALFQACPAAAPRLLPQ